MIKQNDGTKLSPKQAAAKMIWTAVNSFNGTDLLEQTSLYALAGLDVEARTDREEALTKVQFDKLSTRVKKLLKVA